MQKHHTDPREFVPATISRKRVFSKVNEAANELLSQLVEEAKQEYWEGAYTVVGEPQPSVIKLATFGRQFSIETRPWVTLIENKPSLVMLFQVKTELTPELAPALVTEFVMTQFYDLLTVDGQEIYSRFQELPTHALLANIAEAVMRLK